MRAESGKQSAKHHLLSRRRGISPHEFSPPFCCFRCSKYGGSLHRMHKPQETTGVSRRRKSPNSSVIIRQHCRPAEKCRYAREKRTRGERKVFFSYAKLSGTCCRYAFWAQAVSAFTLFSFERYKSALLKQDSDSLAENKKSIASTLPRPKGAPRRSRRFCKSALLSG